MEDANGAENVEEPVGTLAEYIEGIEAQELVRRYIHLQHYMRKVQGYANLVCMCIGRERAGVLSPSLSLCPARDGNLDPVLASF